MAVQYFTLAEANALLSKIEPLMAQLLARRAKVVRQRQQLGDLIEDIYSGGIGGTAASQMAQDFDTIEQLVEKIQAYGCVIKDINIGLLDFLTERNGREVYLCWRYGEPEIAFYHELHTGFTGRRSV